MSTPDCQIISERVNLLLRRREIEFKVYHKGTGTPSKHSIREYFSSSFNVPLEQVYVYGIYTEFGCGVSRGIVHIYDTIDAANIVPIYIKIRNLKPEDRKKGTEELKKKKFKGSAS